MKKLLLLSILLISSLFVKSQGVDCSTADPFCTGTTYTFPASTSTTSQTGPDYDCLLTQPNPAWYFLQVATSGNLVLGISQASAGGSGQDVDFVCWGPFTSASAACVSGLPASTVIDCSYSTAATETCTIPSAVSGQFYMLLLTNYSGQPGNITLSQTGGTGSTNCNILCAMNALTVVIGACDPVTNLFNLTGTITYTDPPTSGTLTITSSCGGSQTFTAPFAATSVNYSLPGLLASGGPCTVTAVFSGDPTCTLTTPFTAPSCSLICSITSLTATPSSCTSSMSTYSVNGVVSFINPPATGTLTITNSCGGSPTSVNAPFVGPYPYSFIGLTANGLICTLTAVFSSDPTCTLTQTYTAPVSCNCSISTLTATPSVCDPVTNNYSVTGSVSFINPPTTGTLTISNSCGGTPQVFNAPFVGPYAYALNGLPSNGLPCTITAVFLATPTCTLTQTYTAPANCVTCPVTATNNGPLCVGQTLNLTATTVVGATYNWTGPGGFTSTLQNPTITNVTLGMAGNYTVTVTLISPACTSSSTTSVVINPNPVISVNSPTTCVGETTTLTATGATNYIWSTTDVTSTITVPGTADTYTVIGTTNGCSDTIISAVTTYQPTSSFTADTLHGCNPLNVNFTADQIGNTGASYSWTFGDGHNGLGPNPSNYYTTNGCQNVTLTVSFSSTCFATTTIPCMINIYPQPDANFLVTPNNIDITNPIAQFQNLSTYSNIWQWNFGDSTFSNSENPSHVYPEEGTYLVTLYSSNSNGCIDSISYNVIVGDVSMIYIPNTFTPNYDNVNDVWYIKTHGIDPNNFQLLIFDRWGNQIFQTNDFTQGWNGSVNNVGLLVQQDVYVYKIFYKDLKGHKKTSIGHVTVYR